MADDGHAVTGQRLGVGRWDIADDAGRPPGQLRRAGRHAARIVGRAELPGRRVARQLALLRHGLHGEAVGDLVPAVPRVALHPGEADVTSPADGLDERLPQVPVRHRLALGVQPSPPLPALPPAVPEAVHDVGRIAADLERAAVGVDGLRGGGDLHPLVGGVTDRPRGEGAVGLDPCPAAPPRVAAARPVGVDDGERLVGRHRAEVSFGSVLPEQPGRHRGGTRPGTSPFLRRRPASR